MIGACAFATMAARSRAAPLPSWAGANCCFKITITCWLTCMANCEASARVNGMYPETWCSGAAEAALATTEVPATTAITEPAAAREALPVLPRPNRAPLLLRPGILASSLRGGQAGHRDEPTPKGA